MQNYSYQNPKIELIGNQKTFASDQNADLLWGALWKIKTRS